MCASRMFSSRRSQMASENSAPSTLVRTFRPHEFRAVAAAGLLCAVLGTCPAWAEVHEIMLAGPEAGVVGEVPFQSHNQKVVVNRRGIFITHAGGVLQRSTDGAKSFKTIFNAMRDGLKPPTIETDTSDNVYLLYPEGRRTRFLKFTASNDYRKGPFHVPDRQPRQRGAVRQGPEDPQSPALHAFRRPDRKTRNR